MAPSTTASKLCNPSPHKSTTVYQVLPFTFWKLLTEASALLELRFQSSSCSVATLWLSSPLLQSLPSMLWLSGIWPSPLSTTSSPILSHITFCLDGGSGPRWSHCLPAMAKASCSGLADSSFQIGHSPIPLKTLGDLTQKYLLALATLSFSVKSLNQDVGYAKQVLCHWVKTQIHPFSLVYPSYSGPSGPPFYFLSTLAQSLGWDKSVVLAVFCLPFPGSLVWFLKPKVTGSLLVNHILLPVTWNTYCSYFGLWLRPYLKIWISLWAAIWVLLFSLRSQSPSEPGSHLHSVFSKTIVWENKFIWNSRYFVLIFIGHVNTL